MQTNDGTRSDAAEALCEVGPSTPGVVQALLSLLGDPEAGYSAAHGLAVMSLRDGTIVPALVDSVRRGTNLPPKAPSWTMVALKEIGLNNATAAIDALLPEWPREKVRNKLTADTRTVVPALEEMLQKSPPLELRWTILEALQQINTTDPGEEMNRAALPPERVNDGHAASRTAALAWVGVWLVFGLRLGIDSAAIPGADRARLSYEIFRSVV